MFIKRLAAYFTATALLVSMTGCTKSDDGFREADASEIVKSLRDIYNSSCESCRRIAELRFELVKFYEEVSSYKDGDTCIAFAEEDPNLIPATFNGETDHIVNEIESLKGHKCSDSKKINVSEVSFCLAAPDMPVNAMYYTGKYSGEWQSGFPNGNGVFAGAMVYGDTADSLCYSGDWVDGEFEGQGELLIDITYDGGYTTIMYNGGFEKFRRSGDGIYYKENQNYSMYVLNGEYSNDALVNIADYYECDLEGNVTDQGKIVDSGDPAINRKNYVYGMLPYGIEQSAKIDREYAEKKAEKIKNATIVIGTVVVLSKFFDKYLSFDPEKYLEEERAARRAGEAREMEKREKERKEAEQAAKDAEQKAYYEEEDRRRNYDFWSSQYESDLKNYGYYNSLTEESERNMYFYS